MSVYDPCLIGLSVSSAASPIRLGVPLLDKCLEFVAARCRPNTVLAVAFDLKVFFGFVPKPPSEITSSDALAFISAQRAGGDGRTLRVIDEVAGLSARTVALRLRAHGLAGKRRSRPNRAVTAYLRHDLWIREEHSTYQRRKDTAKPDVLFTLQTMRSQIC